MPSHTFHFSDIFCCHTCPCPTCRYVISDIFLAVVSSGAAAGFLLYGGRLFLMLQVRIPAQ
jgi:hypothetical protein